MNLAWLLKSSNIWMAMALSGAITASILLFTPGGLPSLRKRQDELYSHKLNLYGLSRQNMALFDEVRRLNEKDPELMEALVRRVGYDRPGEVVYVFGDHTAKR
ncbi:MAG: septum formation initiator family protein [Holophagales bacterium]|jgi:cell division protein FtsB|nr:septum formation initiator family protein [Holophagales bacterium]